MKSGSAGDEGQRHRQSCPRRQQSVPV